MIDIHTHILPAIDDGADSVEDALEMLQLFVADGVTHVVATPHVYPRRFDNDSSVISTAFYSFQALAEPLELPLSISFAGEVRLTEHLPDLIARDAIPFLGVSEGYRTMLLELPDVRIPVGTDHLLRWLNERRIRPVIAHPERNRQISENPVIVKSMIDLGCRIQLTAGSLLGTFGPRIVQAARFLLDRDWVDAIASDTHNRRARRPCMSLASDWLSKNYNADLAERLTMSGPALLCGFARTDTESGA